jgi:hypothetical protein
VSENEDSGPPAVSFGKKQPARHMDVQTHLSCPYGTAPLLLTRENDPQRLSTHLAALGIRSASQPIVLYHRAAPGWVGVSGMMLMRPF